MQVDVVMPVPGVEGHTVSNPDKGAPFDIYEGQAIYPQAALQQDAPFPAQKSRIQQAAQQQLRRPPRAPKPIKKGIIGHQILLARGVRRSTRLSYDLQPKTPVRENANELKLAVRQGFEPRLRPPEDPVLPLHHRTV